MLEGASVVSTIAHYPTYVRFFSTAEKLSLGGLPFVVATEKPTRRDGLAYYRAVVRHFEIPLRQYERVTSIERDGDGFVVHSDSRVARRAAHAGAGGRDRDRLLRVAELSRRARREICRTSRTSIAKATRRSIRTSS